MLTLLRGPPRSEHRGSETRWCGGHVAGWLLSGTPWGRLTRRRSVLGSAGRHVLTTGDGSSWELLYRVPGVLTPLAPGGPSVKDIHLLLAFPFSGKGAGLSGGWNPDPHFCSTFSPVTGVPVGRGL